jgi:hypothetical protein
MCRGRDFFGQRAQLTEALACPAKWGGMSQRDGEQRPDRSLASLYR